jgi:hypothetical protein
MFSLKQSSCGCPKAGVLLLLAQPDCLPLAENIKVCPTVAVMNLCVDCLYYLYSIRRSCRCHYGAQVTWAPLYTFSCYHGATSVIIGNCSLALGPVRRGNEERLAEFLSYVEAIPMEVLRSINVTWQIVGEYSAGTPALATTSNL